MANLKVGDRVKFAAEGVVVKEAVGAFDDGPFDVHFDNCKEVNRFNHKDADKFTVIPRPIQVGDKVDYRSRASGPYNVVTIHPNNLVTLKYGHVVQRTNAYLSELVTVA